MIGQQKDGKFRHYDVHSLYGLSESIVTIKAARQATGKRSFILSRSTYLGSGHYGGHWLGTLSINSFHFMNNYFECDILIKVTTTRALKICIDL